MPCHLLKKKMSKGGAADMEGVHIGTKPKGGSSMAGEIYRGSEKAAPAHKKEYLKDIAYSMHKSKLEELKKMPSPKLLAHGGIAHQSECDQNCNHPCEVHEMNEDLVGQVLSQRMSKGGRVSNEDEPMADFMPNEFDDLHLRDGLEFNYTGENSGEMDSPEKEEKKRSDMVSMEMLKRKKGRMPRPA